MIRGNNKISRVEVSILRPCGYGPHALPLRQLASSGAFKVFPGLNRSLEFFSAPCRRPGL